jgi:C-terminal processing protease CtpA/Prc
MPLPKGLEKFDIIVAVDGKATNRQDGITDIIRTKKVGDKVDLLIVRDKHFKNIIVTLQKLEITADELYNKQGGLQPPG